MIDKVNMIVIVFAHHTV